MKKIITLFAGTLVASAALADDRVKTIPSLDKVLVIRLSPLMYYDFRWEAHFFPDGCGHIGLSDDALGRHAAGAEKGTFSFEEIYNLLVPHLKLEREYVEDIGVSLIYGDSPEERTFVGGGCLGDPETIRQLIRLFQDKMKKRDAWQFEEIFFERPLVQGYDADGTPILGYIRKPYVDKPSENTDPFADNPKQPQTADDEPDDDGAATPPPQPAIQETPTEPPAVEQTPAVGDKTPTDIAEGEPNQAENNASNRWLFAGIVLALATAFYLLRRRK